MCPLLGWWRDMEGRGRITFVLNKKKRESLQFVFNLWLVFYSDKAAQEIQNWSVRDRRGRDWQGLCPQIMSTSSFFIVCFVWKKVYSYRYVALNISEAFNTLLLPEFFVLMVVCWIRKICPSKVLQRLELGLLKISVVVWTSCWFTEVLHNFR